MIKKIGGVPIVPGASDDENPDDTTKRLARFKKADDKNNFATGMAHYYDKSIDEFTSEIKQKRENIQDLGTGAVFANDVTESIRRDEERNAPAATPVDNRPSGEVTVPRYRNIPMAPSDDEKNNREN